MIESCKVCSAQPVAQRGLAARFQDEKYGEGRRVHNIAEPSGGKYGRRVCVCCGTTTEDPRATPPQTVKQKYAPPRRKRHRRAGLCLHSEAAR